MSETLNLESADSSVIEKEVYPKIRKKLGGILLKLGNEGDVDDNLLQYLMLLISNKHPKSQVTHDLTAFFEDETPSFVEWLFDTLRPHSEGLQGEGDSKGSQGEDEGKSDGDDLDVQHAQGDASSDKMEDKTQKPDISSEENTHQVPPRPAMKDSQTQGGEQDKNENSAAAKQTEKRRNSSRMREETSARHTRRGRSPPRGGRSRTPSRSRSNGPSRSRSRSQARSALHSRSPQRSPPLGLSNEGSRSRPSHLDRDSRHHGNRKRYSRNERERSPLVDRNRRRRDPQRRGGASRLLSSAFGSAVSSRKQSRSGTRRRGERGDTHRDHRGGGDTHRGGDRHRDDGFAVDERKEELHRHKNTRRARSSRNKRQPSLSPSRGGGRGNNGDKGVEDSKTSSTSSGKKKMSEGDSSGDKSERAKPEVATQFEVTFSSKKDSESRPGLPDQLSPATNTNNQIDPSISQSSSDAKENSDPNNDKMKAFIEQSDTESAPGGVSKPVARQRCGYWPKCNKGSKCLFHHPTEVCRFALKGHCQFGDACLNIHPHIPRAKTTRKRPACKFGSHCKNTKCPFLHQKTPFLKKKLKPNPGMKTMCRYGAACYNKNCAFSHPRNTIESGENDVFKSKPIVCRFDETCERIGCQYQHPKRDNMDFSIDDRLHASENKTVANGGSDVVHKRVKREEEEVEQISVSLPVTP